MNNIFVYCEIEGGKVADVSLELLTKGRALADTLGCELEALALGQGLAGVEKQLAEYGADVVHVADCECLAPYRTLPRLRYFQGGTASDRAVRSHAGRPRPRSEGFVGAAQRSDGRLHEPRNRPAYRE